MTDDITYADLKSRLHQCIQTIYTFTPHHLTHICSILIGETVNVNLELATSGVDSLTNESFLSAISEPVEPGSVQDSYRAVYYINLFYDILSRLSPEDLSILLSIIQADLQLIQLRRIEGIYGVLTQLGPHAIDEINKTVIEVQDNHEMQISRLKDTLVLDDQHFHLYQTLVLLFSQKRDFIHNLSSAIVHFNEPQLHIISRVASLNNEEFYSFLQLFAVPETSSNLPLDMAAPVSPVNQSSFSLTITEQPPERCVYKRNIKPGPVVTVQGGTAAEMAGNIHLVCIAARCDTEEDVPQYLTGNPAQSLSSNRIFEWKRLKLTVTSHQQNETLFCLRFELRLYPPNVSVDNLSYQYEVLAEVTTNPICVLSHSTQLRQPQETLPTITEVLPASGSTSGFTKVAILGADFVESPTTRVRFGNVEVHPIFHGPKTLVCRTPAHAPGVVEVRVCNEVNGWSQTCGRFYYEPSTTKDSVSSPGGVVAFESGVETARVVQRR